jgi:hypothetical protein
LKLFAPFEAALDRTKRSGRSHIGEERVAFRSRQDHGPDRRRSMQVITQFDAAAESKPLACLCEPSHRYFVTWDTPSTRFRTPRCVLKIAVRLDKSQIECHRPMARCPSRSATRHTADLKPTNYYGFSMRHTTTLRIMTGVCTSKRLYSNVFPSHSRTPPSEPSTPQLNYVSCQRFSE